MEGQLPVESWAQLEGELQHVLPIKVRQTKIKIVSSTM